MAKTKDLLIIANKKPKKVSIFSTIIVAVLIIYCAVLIFMMVWALLTSFKSYLEFNKNPFNLPEKWVFENYLTALDKFYIERSTPEGIEYVKMPIMFLYGFLYAFGCSFAATFVPCIVGYLCARFKYALSKIIFYTVIICMILPIVGSLPSEIQMARSLGIYNQIWGTWIMKANFLGLYFIVFYNYFKALPNAYSEAAKIDGASNFRILFKVILPMALPLFFTVMLINFITFWNDYQTPLIYLQSYPTIALGMYSIGLSEITGVNTAPVKIAAAFLVLIPVLILFLAFHKKLLGNLTMGGIKG